LKTGLFSVIVGAFIIESYKTLFPASSDETNVLLRQISQQLTGLENRTLAQRTENPSFSPSRRMVCVNTMWLLSLVLSIASALSATLTQQWARRYVQLPEMPSLQKDQARVRSYLFLGIQKYYMLHAVEMTPTLLHCSVFMFFVGLVLFFFSINNTVAIAVSVSVGLFALAYFTLTVLPCIAHDCPYRTPMSYIWWFLWHASLSSTAFCLRWFLKQVHSCLVPSNPGEVTSFRQRKLVEWIYFSQDAVEKHAERLKDGFRRSIIKGALEAPPVVDVEALCWLFKLPALADKSKIQEFMAGIPGEMVIRLMNASLATGRIHFRDHLYTLLRSCASATARFDEKVRKSRLLICLKVVHHAARASFDPHGITPFEHVMNDFRINFANVGLMRTFWADSDPAIRVISRSICALLAGHFLHKYPLTPSELAWLGDVLGKPSSTIYTSIDNPAKVDSINIDSFVHGSLLHQTKDLPIDQAILFVETFVILKSSGSQIALRKETFEDWISGFSEQADEQDLNRQEVVEKLRKIAKDVFPETVQELQFTYTTA
jgi:Family of unknown function (DUF6535)